MVTPEVVVLEEMAPRVQINPRMSLFEQICNIAKKATAKVLTVYQLMANIEGPLSSRRRLLVSVVQSVLL